MTFGVAILRINQTELRRRMYNLLSFHYTN